MFECICFLWSYSRALLWLHLSSRTMSFFLLLQFWRIIINNLIKFDKAKHSSGYLGTYSLDWYGDLFRFFFFSVCEQFYSLCCFGLFDSNSRVCVFSWKKVNCIRLSQDVASHTCRWKLLTIVWLLKRFTSFMVEKTDGRDKKRFSSFYSSIHMGELSLWNGTVLATCFVFCFFTRLFLAFNVKHLLMSGLRRAKLNIGYLIEQSGF